LGAFLDCKAIAKNAILFLTGKAYINSLLLGGRLDKGSIWEQKRDLNNLPQIIR
jgi:hypothetical protein